MKVSELITKLQELNQDDSVYMAIDPEGNGYALLNDIGDNNVYSELHETIGIKALTKQLQDEGFCEDDIYEGESCIVLWP